MNKNPNAVDDFLNFAHGDEDGGNENPIKSHNDKPFAEVDIIPEGGKEDDGTKVPGPKEKEGEGDEPASFHNNPKVKRYIEKEVRRLTQHLTPKEAETVREQVNKGPDPLGALKALIGDDTPEKVNTLNQFSEWMNNVQRDARAGIERIESERKAEQEAQEMLDRGFDSIEDSFDVDLTSNDPTARKTRGEFIDFITKVAPKNQFGEIVAYPDFVETYTLFQELKSKPSSTNARAKDLASRSMARSGDASRPQMPADTSWRGVEKFFSSLKKGN